MPNWSRQHLDKRRSQLSNLLRGTVVPELVENVPDGERRDVTLIWDPDPHTKLKLEVRTSHHVHKLAIDYSPEFLEKLRDDPSTITETDFYAWWIRPKTPTKDSNTTDSPPQPRATTNSGPENAAASLVQTAEMIQGARDRSVPRIVEGDVTIFVQPQFPHTVKTEIYDRPNARTIHVNLTAAGWTYPYANGHWTLPPKGAKAFGFFFVVPS